MLDGWLAWYEQHRERWEYEFSDRMRILFLETRFAHYWRNLLRLDFGVSLVTKEPVLETLISKLPYSLTLSVGSLLLAYCDLDPARHLLRGEEGLDSPIAPRPMVLFMLYSLPSFFVATLLLFFFSYGLGLRVPSHGSRREAGAAREYHGAHEPRSR